MAELTPSQQKALSQERHLSVTANAGSGKTRVMVERFVRLFETHPELTVQHVVAITFTDNAGAELRKRILGRVTDLLADPAITPERRMRLVRLRDTLPAANIGSIHSFALRQLRAYPVEARVDASFGIVQGADQRLLREGAIDRVFYSTLEEAYTNNEDPLILQLFRTLGRHSVRNVVRTLMDKRSLTAKLQEELLSQADENIISMWRSQLEPLLVHPKQFRNLLADIESSLKDGDQADEVRPLFASYFAAKSRYEHAAALGTLAELLISPGGLHRDRVNKKTLSTFLNDERELFIELCREHGSLLSSLPPTEPEWETQHRTYLSMIRAAVDLTARVTLEYQNDKASYGVLDFDDLVLKFERLLHEDRIREELSRQFRFIMIDEYQDTDATQFELAKRLTMNLTTGNLMVVGDPKQSIYGFRDADVTVFQETERSIVDQSLSDDALREATELGLTDGECRGSLSLSESFRMAPAPLAAINRVFRTLMADDSSDDHSVSYNNLVWGRDGGGQGGVEWICPSKSTGDEEAGEFELLAQKIKSIVNGGGTKYQIQEDRGYRAARYDDIAILLRTRAPLVEIEQALRAEGIPFVVSKGSGFFLQQEILDAISYLSFLIASHDDLSLVSILRSPFFALTDVDLFQISAHVPESGLSYWERLQSYAQTIDHDRLTQVVEQLQANLAVAGRSSAATVLNKIVKESTLLATLAARPDGHQKIANLEKLLAMARASDISGFSSLFDFVERARYLIREAEDEAQAEPVKGQNAVQIMTVHAAKGLEFPIVFIPQLTRTIKADNTGMLEPALGFHIRLPDGQQQPFIAELLRERSRPKVIAEEKRVLYVAMTRAKDHLILCSTLPKTPPTTNWLAWIAEAFPAVWEEDVDAVTIDERVQRYDTESQKTTEQYVSFSIPFIRSASEIPAVEDNLAAAAKPILTNLHLDPVSSPLRPSRYSATQLLRYRECPTKYYLTYGLGIPTESKLALDYDEPAAAESVSGSVLGQVVHLLLSTLEKIAPDGTLDEAAFRDEIDTIFLTHEIWDGRKELMKLALQHVSQFLDSSLAIEVIAAKESYAEYALQTVASNGDIFFGIIDRLYQTPDGVWTILDYKTERSNEHAGEARYEFQMRFYAYLVNRIFPDQGQIHAKLFYTFTGDVTEFVFDQESIATFETTAFSIIDSINRDAATSELNLLGRNLEHCPDCKFADAAGQCIVLKADAHSGQVAQFA